jgi:hypothetical protein
VQGYDAAKLIAHLRIIEISASSLATAAPAELPPRGELPSPTVAAASSSRAASCSRVSSSRRLLG